MAADAMRDVRTEAVAIPRAGASQPMAAFLAGPDRPGQYPGVVVIHEIFGLTENIREIARRFAPEGYVALAVDLFSGGARPVCLLRIFHGILVRPLNNGVVAELQDALGVLQRRPEVDPGRVGVIGFCMGGTYALQLACVDGDLRAASVFYGQNPRPLDAVARACPIVGSYPAKDFTAVSARRLEQALTRSNVPHDLKIYPGTWHGFFNASRSVYAPEAAADAWARTLTFFETHLRANPAG
jgi:carboxymethylenebutenolidase